MLFAARQIVGRGLHAVFQARKNLQDFFLAPDGAMAAVGGPRQPAQRQVVSHRHTGKQTAPLRHIADPQACNIRGRQTGDVAPGKFDLARRGLEQTGQRLQQRGLAGAVATQQRHDLAFAHVKRRIVQDVAFAIKRIDALKAQQLRALAGRTRHAAGDGRRSRAGVHLLYALISTRLFWRTRHQHAALVHYRHALRKPEHTVNVVLDDQHRNIAGDGLDQMRHALSFGCRQAGQRFVHQQHLWSGAQRDAEIDQPLAAIRQLAAFSVFNALESEKFHQFTSLCMDFRVAVDVAPGVEAAWVLRLQRQPQIFIDRQAAKQIGDLKRARQPLPANAVRRQMLDFFAVQTHRAGVWREHAGDQVEGCRLARSVRSDQRVNLTGLQSQPGTFDCLDAAKVFVEGLDFQHQTGSRCGPQKGGQGQAFVNAALAHGGNVFDHRAPAALQPRPDADQAGRRKQNEADEGQAEPEQPVFGVNRQQLTRQNVEQRAERGSQKAAHAAYDHDGQQLAGKRDRGRFGRGDAMVKYQQRTGQPGDGGRQHEHRQLVPVRVVALKRGALLVLANGDDDVAKRRADDAQQHVKHSKADQADERQVHGRMLQIDGADGGPHDATQARFAAGKGRPAKGDGEGERRQRQGKQREVDAAPAQNQKPHHARQQRRTQH